MIESLALLPADMPLWAAAGLVALSFAASLIAAAIGLGGGILMLAAMANLLPAAAIVPVHAVVQLGSNAGRAWIMHRHVDRTHFWPFLTGTALGIAIGSSIYATLPVNSIKLILGMFILQTIWLPLPFIQQIGRAGVSIAGAIAAFLTMFIGATGPFVATIWQALKLAKHTKVATHAAAMTLQHGLKITAFVTIGFNYAPYLTLTAALILSGLAGTLIGNRILNKTPDKRFHMTFKWLLTLLALGILWQAAAGLAA